MEPGSTFIGRLPYPTDQSEMFAPILIRDIFTKVFMAFGLKRVVYNAGFAHVVDPRSTPHSVLHD